MLSCDLELAVRLAGRGGGVVLAVWLVIVVESFHFHDLMCS